MLVSWLAEIGFKFIISGCENPLILVGFGEGLLVGLDEVWRRNEGVGIIVSMASARLSKLLERGQLWGQYLLISINNLCYFVNSASAFQLIEAFLHLLTHILLLICKRQLIYYICNI